MSGVTVPTTMRSTSCRSKGCDSCRFFTASTARSLAATPLSDQMALADAGALQDPLVGGVDHLFQVLIGQNARRNVGAESGDFGATSQAIECSR